ncbi:hypothetical protein HMPREF0970_00213 [Schaalia odontolytica F0309]|uniref:Uncharacterized protein n=1 Tax=Schaalia odontolytica F0309 TaxID=649742 RepID=D4TWA4_9ACTO|nr:hypothetical protein HMPREF0970_00213 [Schaalia odontolytica F0309]
MVTFGSSIMHVMHASFQGEPMTFRRKYAVFNCTFVHNYRVICAN